MCMLFSLYKRITNMIYNYSTFLQITQSALMSFRRIVCILNKFIAKYKISCSCNSMRGRSEPENIAIMEVHSIH